MFTFYCNFVSKTEILNSKITQPLLSANIFLVIFQLPSALMFRRIVNFIEKFLHSTYSRFLLFLFFRGAPFGYLYSFSFLIAYIHPVYGRIRIHDLLIMRLVP